MHTSSSPAEFTARILKTARNVEQVPRAGAHGAALVMKESIGAEINSVAPGGRMSGVGKKGARVGVRYTDGTNSAGRATVILNATGPLHLLERNTTGHEIFPRGFVAKTARGRSTGTQALASKGGSWGPFAHAWHPGTHGQHPFEKGVERGRPLTGAAYRLALFSALKKDLG